MGLSSAPAFRHLQCTTQCHAEYATSPMQMLCLLQRLMLEAVARWLACRTILWNQVRRLTGSVRVQEAAVRARRAASGGHGAAPAAKPAEAPSPFVAIAATMGWETFHLVQVLWLGIIDLPVNSPEKDWQLQVGQHPESWQACLAHIVKQGLVLTSDARSADQADCCSARNGHILYRFILAATHCK